MTDQSPEEIDRCELCDEPIEALERGEEYLDDRTVLACAYNGLELVAILHDMEGVRVFEDARFDVVPTPAGEDRGVEVDV